MTLRRRAVGMVAALAALAGAAISTPVPVAAAVASTTTVSPPSTPGNLTTRVGVDGVSLSWYRGTVSTTAGMPTAYVVRRYADGHDQSWVVDAFSDSTSGSMSDTSLPTGLPATYTVAARNSAGDSAESPSATATVPAWDGPYSPARKVLTMVWDQAEAGSNLRRETTQVTPDSPTPLTQSVGSEAAGFSSGAIASISLPRDVADGDYAVGSDGGMLAMTAASGATCAAPVSGTASVRHAAPSLTGGYASISLDANLVCGDGHHLAVELRWSTPEDFHAVGTAPLTVIEAQPGEAATGVVTVSNSGPLDVSLGAARLVDADLSTSVPLAVTSSTCEGHTVSAGQTCAVTITYTAGAKGSAEGNGILAIRSDRGELELGRVVGEQPASISGPQAITITGKPGRVDLSWAAPGTLDDRLIDSWRVEETDAAAPVVLERLMTSDRSGVLLGLPVGAHTLRVVLRTRDGREIPSAALAVSVPRRWLLVATDGGVRALDPDGGHTDGGLFGPAISARGVAMSPSRDAVVVAEGPADGSVQTLTPTGAGLHFLTYDSVFADEDPAVSPDGSRVMLYRPGYAGASTRASSLVLVPVAGGAETTVPTSEGLRTPSWTPDGSAVIAGLDGDVGLVRVVPATGARTALPGTAGGRSPAVSRTGRVAYLVRNFDHDEIRVVSLTGGASTLVGTQDGLTRLAWDPSGSWLAATGGQYGMPQHTYVYDLSGAPMLLRTLPGGSAVAWLDTASVPPVASLAAPAWTTRAASVSVVASDADDAVGGLRRECRLDAATTWIACAPTWSLTGLAAGSHTAYARATDPSGHQSATVSRSWNVDGSAPSAVLGAVPSVLTTPAVTLGWTAADSGGSGLASYAMRERYAALSGSLGGFVYPSVWQSLGSRALSVRLTPGLEYCFSVRARDVAGNLGAWSAERCTVVALDDRAMSASRGWSRGTARSYAYGTWSRAAYASASLARTSVRGRRIVLVVVTCPTCGAVDVYHAGVRLGRISLYSAKTAYRQLRWLPLESVTRLGTVVVRTVSGRPVIVDAIAAFH